MSTIFIYIINFALLGGISYCSYRRYRNGDLKRHFWPALLFKVSCGLLLGLLFYGHYGGGDTIEYYKQASNLAELKGTSFFSAIVAGTVPSQPVRAIYFVRLVALFKYLTQADYWLLSAYFSLFSFLGAFYLSDKLVQWSGDLKLPALCAFLYFPSLVFWSSGLLKESLVFAALTVLLGSYFSWHQNGKLHVGIFLLGVLALSAIISLKYYIAAVLIPLLIYLMLYHLSIWEHWKISETWKKTGIIALVLIIPMLLFFTWLSPNLGYNKIWEIMQQNHEAYLLLAPEGAVYTFTWFGNGLDLLVNLPYLWFSGIFRPTLGEDMAFPAILSTFENLILIVGTVLAIYFSFKRKMEWTAELIAIFIYLGVLSVFLSYSTPNFGTLARFKIYYVPFLVMLVVYQLQSLKIFRAN